MNKPRITELLDEIREAVDLIGLEITRLDVDVGLYVTHCGKCGKEFKDGQRYYKLANGNILCDECLG
jgi:hypothetical protein